MNMMENWGLLGEQERVSLTQSVANARSACKLKYIIGAAPVVYGIPMIIE